MGNLIQRQPMTFRTVGEPQDARDRGLWQWSPSAQTRGSTELNRDGNSDTSPSNARPWSSSRWIALPRSRGKRCVTNNPVRGSARRGACPRDSSRHFICHLLKCDPGALPIVDNGAVQISAPMDVTTLTTMGFEQALHVRTLAGRHLAYFPWHSERIFKNGGGHG